MNKKQKTTLSKEEILESLWTRECCKGNAIYHVSKEEATEHHMSMVSNPIRERELLQQGNQLFEQGYRIRQSARKIRGVSHQIPSGAITHRIVSAGYLATNAMSRLQYVTQNS